MSLLCVTVLLPLCWTQETNKILKFIKRNQQTCVLATYVQYRQYSQLMVTTVAAMRHKSCTCVGTGYKTEYRQTELLLLIRLSKSQWFLSLIDQ